MKYILYIVWNLDGKYLPFFPPQNSNMSFSPTAKYLEEMIDNTYSCYINIPVDKAEEFEQNLDMTLYWFPDIKMNWQKSSEMDYQPNEIDSFKRKKLTLYKERLKEKMAKSDAFNNLVEEELKHKVKTFNL